MTDERRQAVRRVFMEVADLPGDEREAALANACGDDAVLRAEVEALLQADARAGGFMSDPTSDAAGSDGGGRRHGPLVAARGTRASRSGATSSCSR